MDFYSQVILPLISSNDNLRIIRFFQQRQLLALAIDCGHCRQPMELRPKRVIDGFAWYCVNARCGNRHNIKSVRASSFFEKSRIPLAKHLHMLYLWSQDAPVKMTTENTGLSKMTVIQWFSNHRNICSQYFANNPIQMGGPGIILEIDESLFRHKPKYHRGRQPQHNSGWVFGIVDTSSTPAVGYMQIVPDRTAGTLLGILQQVARPGSIIRSDSWRAYRAINRRLPQYQHQMVNHSLNFVDPVTGVHTQHVESYWNKTKLKLKRMHGSRIDLLPSYLEERMWRDRFARSTQDAFDNLVGHIFLAHPV